MAGKQRSNRRVAGADRFPMLDLYVPMMECAGLLAASELGLFAKLVDAPLTAVELASALHADMHGVTRLADLLVVTGYLERRRGGRYANSAHTRRWFTRSGQLDYTPGIEWTRDAWSLVPELGEAIVRGGPKRSLWERMEGKPEMGARFARYMRVFALHSSPAIAQSVVLPKHAKRLLDVGGSHGLHSIAWCGAHPGLTAVVFDHAVSLSETVANIAEHGLGKRIEVQAGDVVTDAIGSGYDVVLYFCVAHNQSAVNNARILKKCSRALNEGGLLIIHDYLRERMPEPYNAAFDLTLLLEVGHRTYGIREYSDWLRRAGLSDVRCVDLDPLELGSVITARKRTRSRRSVRAPKR
jgi:SAM-dependent methyltransferase